MAKKVFVVSDTWFNRPFGQYSDMSTVNYNEQVSNCWNDNIKPKDVVYVLGGFGIGNLYDIVYNLNGEIHFLNNCCTEEDRDNIKELFETIKKGISKELKKRIIFDDKQIEVIPELDCVISYLPLSDWYGKQTGTFCLHGMEQVTNLKEHSINCNSRMWNYVPVDVSKVIGNIGTFEKIATEVTIEQKNQ